MQVERELGILRGEPGVWVEVCKRRAEEYCPKDKGRAMVEEREPEERRVRVKGGSGPPWSEGNNRTLGQMETL